MKKYRIVQNYPQEFVIFKKRKWWFGWKMIDEFFDSLEKAERYITKVHFMKGQYPVVKEMYFK